MKDSTPYRPYFGPFPPISLLIGPFFLLIGGAHEVPMKMISIRFSLLNGDD